VTKHFRKIYVKGCNVRKADIPTDPGADSMIPCLLWKEFLEPGWLYLCKRFIIQTMLPLVCQTPAIANLRMLSQHHNFWFLRGDSLALDKEM